MSYHRVIPRDLFNEANLLKCYGRIFINLENIGKQDLLEFYNQEEGFIIDQNEDDGSTFVSNIDLSGIKLFRPLNSREEWPLLTLNHNDDYISVFDSKGEFTDEFLEIISGV